MWMLLEYDRVLQNKAIALMERSGLQATGLDHEEQLAQIKYASVELLLIGAGWQGATISHLWEQGVSCPSVYIASELNDESYETARRLGCVDAVSYPLPIDYLKRWAPIVDVSTVPQKLDEEPLTPLDEVLRSKNVLNKKRTYTRANTVHESTQVDEISMVGRGRVIAVHSARGGVGKSVLVSMIARQMAQRNYTVAIVDLDPLGNLLAMHRGQAVVTTDEWARLPAQMDERMVKQSLVQMNGFYILPSGKSRDGVDSTTLRRIIYHLAQYFDLVLIDTTPSAQGTYTALELAQKIVFVMTPEWVSFKRFIDEYQAVRYQKAPENVTVVLNRIRKRVSEHARTLRLLEEADIPSDIVRVPEDRTLYRELIGASALVGGRDVQDGLDHLLSALRFDPVLNSTKRGLRRGRRWNV
ncbi:ParA family protein [Alicyclobacillus tolerans]|uniref:AAA family ATPase n=1 Tax=Alicyclobacillus tolerans TaxID=90970 RepID=UPI001F17FAD1|nr:ParA family protein [Alicyclobacillus tolerans]MCF8567786.1 ParA family protein [Alicyclobacillus tolerans]